MTGGATRRPLGHPAVGAAAFPPGDPRMERRRALAQARAVAAGDLPGDPAALAGYAAALARGVGVLEGRVFLRASDGEPLVLVRRDDGLRLARPSPGELAAAAARAGTAFEADHAALEARVAAGAHDPVEVEDMVDRAFARDLLGLLADGDDGT